MGVIHQLGTTASIGFTVGSVGSALLSLALFIIPSCCCRKKESPLSSPPVDQKDVPEHLQNVPENLKNQFIKLEKKEQLRQRQLDDLQSEIKKLQEEKTQIESLITKAKSFVVQNDQISFRNKAEQRIRVIDNQIKEKNQKLKNLKGEE